MACILLGAWCVNTALRTQESRFRLRNSGSDRIQDSQQLGAAHEHEIIIRSQISVEIWTIGCHGPPKTSSQGCSANCLSPVLLPFTIIKTKLKTKGKCVKLEMGQAEQSENLCNFTPVKYAMLWFSCQAM